MNTFKNKGFTVGELLLSLTVIITLIASLFPFYQTARQRATQKSTILEMERWAKAITTYTTDYAKAPTNPLGKMHYKKEIINELTPYLNAIVILDWWHHYLWIWTGKGNEEYGMTSESETDFIIASLGKEGRREGWKYDPRKPDSGISKPKSMEDFERDLVMWNNRFIRGPGSK